MKRRIILLAAALFGLAVLTTDTSAAQSESVKSSVDLSVPGLQLKIGSFSADLLTVAQAPEAASPAKPKKARHPLRSNARGAGGCYARHGPRGQGRRGL